MLPAMPRPKKRVPTLSRHTAAGRARCHWRGKDYYFGQYGAPEAESAFRRFVAEVMSGAGPDDAPPPAGPDRLLAVSGLLLQFKEWAESYYVGPDGTPTREVDNLRLGLRRWRRMFGQMPAAAFGPVLLAEIRDAIIADGLARGTINKRIGAILRCVRWGVGRELLDPSVLVKLEAVKPLRRGRSKAKETAPVRAASDERLKAAAAHTPAPVAATAKLQRWTAARPGEVRRLRPSEIDRADPVVWVYRPAAHKTAHRGKPRNVHLGPKCRALLEPPLAAHTAAGRAADEPLFQPKDAVAALRAGQRTSRRTPESCGNRPGTNRKAAPKRTPGTAYTPNSDRTAVQRACIEAGVPPFSPNRLRHAAATAVRERFGLDTARAALGHAGGSVTEVYAEASADVAARVAAEVG